MTIRRNEHERGQRMSEGFTLWFTGFSGAGKTTVSAIVGKELRDRGLKVEVLDGDIVRTHLSKGLGFSRADRDTNIRRIAFVSKLLTRNGVAVIVAAISPYRNIRDEVRADIGRFVEVFVKCPLETCMERDVKGLYKRAMAGEIPAFTGVSDPYEEPLSPELVLETHREDPETSARRVIATIERLGYLAAELGEGAYEPEDEAVIKRRLARLGYLE
jgi:adenylylsulfate kinase